MEARIAQKVVGAKAEVEVDTLHMEVQLGGFTEVGSRRKVCSGSSAVHIFRRRLASNTLPMGGATRWFHGGRFATVSVLWLECRALFPS